MFAERFARLEHQLSPLLERLSPRVQTELFSVGRRYFLELLAHESVPEYEPSKSLERVLWGVPHQGPLMWAAGVDKTGKLYHVSANQGAAAHMVGSISDGARKGNVKYGIRNPCVPLPSGNALNYLGLPNEGNRVVAGRIREYSRNPRCPVWVSVVENAEHPAETRQDGVILGLRMFDLAGADVLEGNESCPNSAHATGNLRSRFQYRSERFVRQSRRPVGVKVSNDTPLDAVPQLLDLLFEFGFAYVNFGNSSIEYKQIRRGLPAGDRRAFDYFTRSFGGGFTGPALKEKSLALCARASEYLRAGGPGREFHIVRTGGIDCAKDLIESDQAGVSMNQWVTGYWNKFGVDGHKVYNKILREYERAK